MFRSFIFAGFECATGYNARGAWIDQVAATHHDQHADADYARLRSVGIRAAREAIRWPLVDRGGGRYDFSTVQPFVDAAARYDIEVVWDLFHYGYPDGLDLLAEDFPRRFEDYCAAAARFVSQACRGTCYFTPINEPSFFAWAAGDVGRFAPHLTGRGYDLKIALARACIRGIDAIRSVVPRARIVNVDPLCRVALPADRPDLAEAVRSFNEHAVWQAWDMIGGRLLPELGGSRAHLDIVGLNYYWTNQWEFGRDECPLAADDPRRVALRDLVRMASQRYGGDLLITETSHVDDLRPAWLAYVAEEAEALLDEGVPLAGVCLYPILGMPEWHAPDEWVKMGLWDLAANEHNQLTREVCEPMLVALRHAQRLETKYRSHTRPAEDDMSPASERTGTD